MGVIYYDLNTSLGRYRIGVINDPLFTSGANQYFRIEQGHVFETSIAACRDSHNTTTAKCDNFTITGGSGNIYKVINSYSDTYGKFLVYVPNSTSTNVTWEFPGTNGNNIRPLFFYVNGDDVGTVVLHEVYPDSTSTNIDYSGTYAQVTNEHFGYAVITTMRSGRQLVAIKSEGSIERATILDIIAGASRVSSDPYADLDGEGDISGGASGGASGGVHVPGFPGLTATDTGIIGLFAPSTAQMRQLADYMWTDFGGTGTEVVDVLKEIVDAIKRSISNPLDYVIGLNIIPSQGLSVGSSTEIKFGFTSSGVSMPRLSNQYFTVNCGAITFSPVCGDTFLDYAPYSKFSIYLPYIGVKELDPNDCVGHTIGVTYHGDVVTGGLTAYVTKDGAVLYQFSGCCALSIPLSSDGWGSTISGAVQIATQLVTSASGGAAGVAAEAAKDAASVAANPSLLSPQVAHSGAISGGAGSMGIQTPFIIREAVRFHSTYEFNTVTGYPAHYYRTIGDLSGYTVMYDVHLHDIPATKAEISEIETLLKSGVIL